MSGAHKHQGGEEYMLHIVAVPDDHAPPIIRLRHVLKGLLRAHNFRAISVRDVTPKLAELPELPRDQDGHDHDGAGAVVDK